MGWQQFSERKIRALSHLTGIELEMVWNHQGSYAHTWVEARTPDDRHLMLNKRTGEVEWLDNEQIHHFSSCPPARQHPPPSLPSTPR